MLFSDVHNYGKRSSRTGIRNMHSIHSNKHPLPHTHLVWKNKIWNQRLTILTSFWHKGPKFQSHPFVNINFPLFHKLKDLLILHPKIAYAHTCNDHESFPPLY